ncbi:methylcrotonoyl-CoA carboxylase beta chain, mitochondrial-like [Dendronephthya gigantea]|uniref:methylcrotonoyl-CoA carboxylase beta chain, mitochondrial-like n=1 Tax=Dendronephthya gigantea TaxID=151771 RepID=UPI0010696876|nr:methylcrotonoyl-CoA carboxylase beta chain, mitochondrial-like [Dendronephthya gigantea]XP_028405059.1 methylcrotonoyl-CoA carboxylase beta chain, mitochondrial-like [Dendronephthya gigantea]
MSLRHFGKLVGSARHGHILKPLRHISIQTFPRIDGDIDCKSAEFLRNKDFYSVFQETYMQDLTSLDSGANKKAIDRHVKVNKKLLLKDRLSSILDPGSDFLELSPLAGFRLEYGEIQRAGILCGIGRISGQPVLVQGNDATVKGGTAYPVTVKKQLRAQEIAEENSLPCLYLVDSGGAFLPLQAEIFPDEQQGGRVFYNEAIMSSKNIPQICIVCGSCTAGGAYIPTMADRCVIVDKIGTIFLGGPPLVKAATGEIVSAENLGGATVHCSISGCTDYFAKTEQEAFSMTRSIFGSLNSTPPTPHLDFEEALHDPEDLGPLSVHGDSETLPIYKIIARIVDGSRFHEFKEMFGPTLVTGFAGIKGTIVGIIANNGPITSPAASKAAHFVRVCCQQNIPLVFLQDTHPVVDQDPELAKQLARLMSVVACAEVPKVTVIIGRSFGPTSYAMCGRSLQPSFLYLWPTAQISLDEPSKISGKSQNHEEIKEYLDSRYKIKSTSFFSTARLWDDGIILPHQTREVLALSLNASMEKRKFVEESNFPVFRM